MPNIAVTSKETQQLLLSADTNTVTLSENSVVKIDTAIEDVASITREGNAAIVNLKNGEKVVIESYFDDPLDSHHIVFDNGEQLYWAEFANAAGEILPTIKYHFIETISPLLYADTLAALMPWVTGAVAAGATIAAVGSDSDSASSNTPVDSTAAEQLVIAAEEAQQAAEDLLNQAQEDGLITSEEQAQLQDAADAAAEAKDTAQDAVTALPESADKEELQDRLDAINDPITVPPVNDADGNGIDDAFEAAEALVTDAENAHQAAEDVIAGAQEDGLITPAEQQAIQDAVDAATEAEQTAQDAVTALPESTDKDGLQDRLDALTDLEVPAVNDQDGNGIDDAVEQAVADAEAAVAAAEAAYAEAEQAIADADTDGNGLITPAEQAVAQAAIDEAAELKAIAQNAVNALPAEVQVEKDGLQGRLDDLISLTAPAVTDADGNGIDDAFEAAEALVTDAENAHQAAEDVIAGAQEDGLISPAEQQAIQDAVDAATEAEQTAQDAVTALPESTDKDGLQDRLDALTDIEIPAVNDQDGNGIDDAVEQAVADAEAAVAAAESAYAEAEQAIADADTDGNGLITPAEQAVAQAAIDEAAELKAIAQNAVTALPAEVQAEKDGLQERVDALTELLAPVVTDADGDGVIDDLNGLIASAEAAVAAAEAAYAEAEQAIADADTDGNGLITPAEQAVAQAAIDEAAELKAIAQNAVNALPAEVQVEKDGLQGRLDDLISLTAPAVTDADGNGIDDAFEAAEALVTDAENAHQAAEDVIAGAQEDGLISPAEQQAIQDAVDAATEAEQTAQDAVTALPESTDKDGLQDRLDALTDLEVPAVNDQDGNGIDDATDSLIADAEAAVAAAETAYAEAEQAIADADTDGNGLITPAEQAVAQAAIDEAAELKAIAQNAVTALPAEVQAEKDGLQGRLDDLISLTAPAVTDADGNGIDDAFEAAEALVTDAENAHQAAEDVIAGAQEDGLITPAEQQAIQDAVDAATEAEQTAQDAVTALPESTDKDGLQDRLDALTDLEVPAVNDQDGNGIDDAVEQAVADAEAAVAAAESAYAEAEQAIADADTDGNGLITPAEQAVAQAAIDEAAELKAIAQNAVTALPAEVQAEKDGLQGRLDDLISLTAPAVTDADGNGIDDAFEAAEALVTDAENAHQAAEDVIAGAQEDGLITPAEQQAIQDAVDAATEAEQTAQDAVTALPESTDKDGLQDRLDALTDIEIPAVNDANENGIPDDIQDVADLVTAAEAAYTAAEQALADALSDEAVTPDEVDALTAARDAAQEAKADAQAAVDGIVADYPVQAAGFQDRLDALIDIVIPPVKIALDDNVNLDMGNEITTTEPAVVDENVQVINLLESTGGADAGTEVVLSGSTNSLAISISQTSLLAVADAYRVDVLDENGNIVYSAVTQDSELVGDVAGLGILGITGDNTLTATVSDLPAGTYRVVVSNDAGALTNLLDTDGGGISLQELGDAGVLLGADNQQVVLDAVNNALGGGAIAALVTEVILPPVLTLVNGLPVDELVGALNDSLLSNADAISLLGFSVTGLLDTIVDAAATALLSNTLTLLQETSITTQVTSTTFENYSVDNNVLTNDENPELATVTHIQFGDGAAQEVTTGGVSINGEYGVLTIFADGSYEYIGNGDFESIGKSEVFTYTILGADGVTTDSATLTINILDDYAPDVPVINLVSATGDITGTAEAGSTVVVTDDNNNEIGRTVVRADGLWSITNPGLTDGAVLNVIAIDAAGNPSQAASTSVDAQAPITTLVTNTTGDSTPTLQGTIDDPTATVVVTVDSINYTAVNNGDGTWTLADGQLPELADGSYNVTVQAIDAAGNESTITDSLVVEAVLFANDDLNNVNVLDTVIENNLTDSGFIFGLASANVLSELAEIDLSAGGFNFTVAPDTTQDVLIDVNGTTSIDLSALVNSIGALLGQTLSADLMLVNLDTGEIVTTVENALQLTPALLTTVMTAENIEFTDIPEGNYTIAFSSPSGDGALSQLLRAIADVGLLSGVNISIETSTQYSTADATGNILGNGVDTDVADIGEGLTVTQVISAETTHAVNTPIATDNTETAISGNYGILYMQADGSYRYVSNGNINDVGKVDTFTYTVADAAGNTLQAYLNIRTDAEGSTIVWDENDLQADGVITVDAVDDDATVLIAQTNSVSGLLSKIETPEADAMLTSRDVTSETSGFITTYTATMSNTYTSSNEFTVSENTVANGTLNIVAKLNDGTLGLGLVDDTWGDVTATYQVLDADGNSVTGLSGDLMLGTDTYEASVEISNLQAGTYTLAISVINLTTDSGLSENLLASNNGEFTVDTTLSVIETSLNDFTTIEGIYSEEGNLLEEDIVSNVATFTIQQGAETYRFENGHIYQNDVLLQNQDSVNITGTYGILNVDASGKYTYTTQDGSGIGQKESFTYTVNDVGGLSDTANLNIGIGASITGSRYDDSYSSYGGVADTVIYNVLEGAETDATGGNGTDTWTDFNATEGDSIDISALLGEQSVTSETLGNFVTLEQRGEHTVVTIDRDGSATDTTYAKTDLIILENTTASNLVLDDLIKYNQI